MHSSLDFLDKPAPPVASTKTNPVVQRQAPPVVPQTTTSGNPNVGQHSHDNAQVPLV